MLIYVYSIYMFIVCQISKMRLNNLCEQLARFFQKFANRLWYKATSCGSNGTFTV